jgi:hypothetical protein
MKVYVFWDIKQCSFFKVSRYSEVNITAVFRVEEQAKLETRMQKVAGRCLGLDVLAIHYFPDYLIFGPENGGALKHRLIFNEIYRVAYQMITHWVMASTG